jgi:hypothetical protein
MPWSRVTKTFDELGGVDASLYYVDRLLSGLSGGRARLIRYYLVAQPIHPAPACRPSAKQAVALLDPADPLVASFPRPPEVIAKRFTDGAKCFLARSGEVFAGFLWLAENAYDEDEVRCRYELTDPALCVWDYDVHVEPAYRIGRTFARLWDAANAHLAARGVRWSVSRISAFNPGSLAAHGRLGIRTLSSATFLCLGPLQLSVLGAAPYLHASMSEASRPTLRLAAPAAE